jgi:hypothetical protein
MRRLRALVVAVGAGARLAWARLSTVSSPKPTALPVSAEIAITPAQTASQMKS